MDLMTFYKISAERPSNGGIYQRIQARSRIHAVEAFLKLNPDAIIWSVV